ncbi:AraC family transcriptional regulator [Caballeronia novacaledonica]|uniref:AraC family transcriptional regulator n=1 Tax=Caballeronia novacaledonica TaxID=1544861 RepID=A0A2U3I5I9_9BURK|nr:helix-turn-helix domain-containing protein [Caballeronia novacaledonica]SPB15368.1 AraC family transcriptional regulator [Caballeronia novacaledonica]
MARAISFHDASLSGRSEISGRPIVKHVGIVLYDGFSLIGVGTLIEILKISNELQESMKGENLTYKISLLSARGGVVTSSSSICVGTESLHGQRFRACDVLYIAGGTGVSEALANERLIELLKSAPSGNAAINGLGSGHALLAASGLSCETCALQGRDLFAHDYPVRTRDERSHALIYALDLLKRDLGYDIASSAVERLLDNQHVSIMLSEMGTPTAAEKTQESARWLERNCGKQVSVVDAAHTAAMSGRNFSRHFKREMGLTPSQYLLNARMKLSCELLANSELPIDKIARRTGLSSGERLSKLFRKQFSMSPDEFRARKREESIS